MSLVDKTIPDSEAEIEPGSPEDPFRLGWRFVARTLPDGEVDYDQIPLTLEDLLFPEENDRAMHHPAHGEDCFYLYGCLKILMAGVPRSLVLEDCRVDFAIPGVKPLGPDVAVFLDVVEGWSAATLKVGELAARPVLVVEVTSPDTRLQDFDRKRDFYHRANVPCYVIVDSRYHQEVRRDVKLVGFRHTPDEYELIPLDDQGRLWVEPLNLWLTIENDRVVCIDGKNGQVIEPTVGLYLASEAAKAKAQTAELRAETAQAEVQIARAEAETYRARLETAEAEVRFARTQVETAEARIEMAQVRAEIATLKAQTDARAAVERVEAEARAAVERVEAEARAAVERAEAEARAGMEVEAELAALRIELRRPKGD